MKILTSSSSRLFSNNYRGVLCARGIVLSRTQICSFGYPKIVDVSFSLSISLRRGTIHPVVLASSPSSSDIQTQLQEDEPQIEDISQSQTVHVKFQLNRKCSFGHQFLIVGDDPMFGLWDPLKAVPLNWSDGHVWTVELDIPTAKSIKYKFIMKAGNETILWQPGPDRVLQTSETKKTLTVCEDWDNAELQNIIEEEPTTKHHEESLIDSEKLIIAENLIQPRESPGTDEKKDITTTDGCETPIEKPLDEKPMAIVADNITEPMKKPQMNTTAEVSSAISNKDMAAGEKKDITTTDGCEKPLEKPLDEKPMAIVADNIAEPMKKPQMNTTAEVYSAISNKDMAAGENIMGNNGRAVNFENLASTKKAEENLVSYEEVPVLVPGLYPFPTATIEEAPLDETEKNIEANALTGIDKAKDLNDAPKIQLDRKEEHGNDSPRSVETTEMMLKEKQELHDNQHVQIPQLAEEQDQPNVKPLNNGVFDNDIQWGRRTLLEFLSNLGFR
ncbi:unnamed protein product [Ilex paraguariensis]|uniref:CBM20 domain-containing protein n=1 Tax=Ilex paraguariensis TaxID=185542 RepID=A0ABC8R5G8_9AQUA